jgi:hypothetical protein
MNQNIDIGTVFLCASDIGPEQSNPEDSKG